jgi:hypothetical protein
MVWRLDVYFDQCGGPTFIFTFVEDPRLVVKMFNNILPMDQIQIRKYRTLLIDNHVPSMIEELVKKERRLRDRQNERGKKRGGGSRERRRIGIWDNGGRQGGRGKCAGCQAGRPIGLLWAYLRLPNQALPQYQPGIFPPARGI